MLEFSHLARFKNFFFPIVGSILFPAPLFALTAQPTATTSAVDWFSLLKILQNIVDVIIPFVVGLAVLILIYGILGFMSSAADEEKRKEAKNFIAWGIVSIFVMVSVWGLVNILIGTFGFTANSTLITNVYPTTALPTTAPTTLLDLIARMNIIGPYIIGFLISIGVFIIILGILNYIREGDNEEKRAEARMFIIWGVISVFIMLSVWGLVNILVKTFQFDNTVTPTTIPALPQV